MSFLSVLLLSLVAIVTGKDLSLNLTYYKDYV